MQLNDVRDSAVQMIMVVGAGRLLFGGRLMSLVFDLYTPSVSTICRRQSLLVEDTILSSSTTFTGSSVTHLCVVTAAIR